MDLSGSGVLLRGPRPADAEALAAILAVPEVARFAGPPMLRPMGPAELAEMLERRAPDQIRWVVEAAAGGDTIGSCDLNRMDFRNRNCWLGIFIGPPTRWGLGLGSEATRLVTDFAFRRLGMEKVYLAVYEGNERALAAYHRAGYRVEATLERSHLLEGRLVTTRWMAAYRDAPPYTIDQLPD